MERVERLNGAPGKASFAVAALGHLVQPRHPRPDQRELGRDEERVGEDQKDDGQEAERGRGGLRRFHVGYKLLLKRA